MKTVDHPKAGPGRPARRGEIVGVRKGRKRQITHTISPDLLAKVDRLAKDMGQSRAAVINLAIFEYTGSRLSTGSGASHQRS